MGYIVLLGSAPKNFIGFALACDYGLKISVRRGNVVVVFRDWGSSLSRPCKVRVVLGEVIKINIFRRGNTEEKARRSIEAPAFCIFLSVEFSALHSLGA